MIIGRRAFLTGLIAAPVIIRPGILMPVRPLVLDPVQYMDAFFYSGTSHAFETVTQFMEANLDVLLTTGELVYINRDGKLDRVTDLRTQLAAGYYAGRLERPKGWGTKA